MMLVHSVKFFHFFLPYIRLMRLHQPTGIWLLLWPCWWSLGYAGHGSISVELFLLFAVGAIVMRASGCIINDIWDHRIDAQVSRTASRPIASGEISIQNAIAFAILLTSIGAIILFSMNALTVKLGVASLLLVGLYPWMKRWFFMPQLFLGLTFNWGALMAWTAVKDQLYIVPFILYAAGICWTLAYDTIYAHQDKKEDMMLGLKSTAISWGGSTKRYVENLYKMMALLLLLMGAVTHMALIYYFCMIPAFAHLYWQVNKLDVDNPDICQKIFQSNISFGWIVMLAIILGSVPVISL